jgi:hypothetical protein
MTEAARRRTRRTRLKGPRCLTLQGWGLPTLRRKFFLAITPVQLDGGVCGKLPSPLKAQTIESREPEAGFSDIAQIRRLAQ